MAVLSAVESAGEILLGGRYEIATGLPLPAFSGPGTLAVAASDRHEPRRPLYALLIDPAAAAPRLHLADLIAPRGVPGLLSPILRGAVDLPTGRALALVLPRPAGGPVLAGAAIPVDRLADLVVAPVVGVLRALADLGATHRAIRPTTLFWGASAQEGVALGECVSTAPGAGQPAWAEPVPSMTAEPQGRGDGTLADDLYALGATLLALVAAAEGETLATLDQSTEVLIAAKLLHGSLLTLGGGRRLPPRLAEPIANLLADEARHRWTLEDLEDWVRGRRPPTRSPARTPPSARAFALGGVDYTDLRLLAMALARMPAPAAAAELRSPAFRSWIRFAHPIEAAALEPHLGAGGGPRGDDAMLARALMVLDPAAPLRYRGLAFFPDGLGPLLATATAGGHARGATQAVGEALAQRLPQAWLSARAADGVAVPEGLARRLDKLGALMADTRPGFGPERVLYELAPFAPCLAEVFGAHRPTRPSEIVALLDWASKSGRTVEVDRHIAAFVAARAGANVDGLGRLADRDPIDRALAAVRVLAALQDQHGPPEARALAGALLARVLPAADRFKHRPTRADRREAAEQAARGGQLRGLVLALDDPAGLARDAQHLRQARALYRSLGSRKLALASGGGERREAAAAETGARVAAALAGVAATLSFLVCVASVR